MGLAQLVKFLVAELTHLGLNLIFDMCIAFTSNYSFSGRGNVPIDSETLLMTDFVNHKIKPTQSFRSAHRGRVCMHVFIGMSAHMCISICIFTVFLKKIETM
jgi:hypothetical protein